MPKYDPITGRQIVSEGTISPEGIIHAPFVRENLGTPNLVPTQPTIDTTALSYMQEKGLLPSGIATSTNLEQDLMAQLEASRPEGLQAAQLRRASYAPIHEEFAKQKKESEELYRQEYGYSRAMAARAGGGPAVAPGTAEMGFLKMAEDAQNKRLKELEKQKQVALEAADISAFNKIRAQESDIYNRLQQLEDRKWEKQKFLLGLEKEEVGLKQKEKAMDIETISALSRIPAGQTVTIGGKQYTGMAKEEVKPFFTSASLVEIMKALPIGETTTVNDPALGMLKIEGIGKPDVKTKQISFVDANGNQMVATLDEITGEPINMVSLGKAETKTKEGSGGLTTIQLLSMRNQIEDNLRTNPATKAFGELVNYGILTVLDRFNKGRYDSVSDTILMRSLAKITDPTTGVREEEYRTFEGAIGELGRIYTLPKKWIGKGRLTNEGRAQMIREIQDRYNSRFQDYQNQYQYYQNQAGQLGLTIPPPYQTTQTPSRDNIREQVISKGYDYDKLKSEGYSDDEIRKSAGL